MSLLLVVVFVFTNFCRQNFWTAEKLLFILLFMDVIGSITLRVLQTVVWYGTKTLRLLSLLLTLLSSYSTRIGSCFCAL